MGLSDVPCWHANAVCHWLAGLAPVGFYLAYLNLSHVQLRVDKFFEGGSWQVERAKESFAEGGYFGVGPGDGVVKLHLPDAHSDFIFAVAAEEYGAIACLAYWRYMDL
jgi:cell division protein FtsW